MLNSTIGLDLFEAINPSIDAGCDNLVAGLNYCILPTADWNGTVTGNTTQTTIPAPAPTPPGTTDSCYEWHTIVSGDYCGLLENEFGITMLQLQVWNPSLLPDCSNLLLDEAYCVSGPAQVTSQQKRDDESPSSNDVDGGVPVGWPYPVRSMWQFSGKAIG